MLSLRLITRPSAVSSSFSRCLNTTRPLLASVTPLETQLRDGLKSAMKSRDRQAATCLKSVLADATTAVKAGPNPNEPASESAIISALRKGINNRKEAAEIYKPESPSASPEQYSTLSSEISLLEGYLPQAPSMESLTALIDDVVGSLSAEVREGKGAIGPAMKGILEKLGDGARVVDKKQIGKMIPEAIKRLGGVRAIHTSCIRQSHIGSTAIPLPTPVNLEFPFDAPASSSSTLSSRTLSVTGPLGSQSVPIPYPVVIEKDEQNQLLVSVLDAEDRKQRSLWGLTRTLINNAVVGVSTGYKVDLKLVGVGYRAGVEPIPQSLIELQKSIPKTIRGPKPGQQPYVPPPTPLHRLNMKLGYAHPIYIDIPECIKVTTPAPTQIVLAGMDKQKLGLFAAKIRRWRKPEPYRGKGIFVGDETIKLKEVKKK